MDATREVEMSVGGPAVVVTEQIEVGKKQFGADASEGTREEEVKEDCKEEKQTSFVFKEMLSDEDTAVPTYDQLERYGLFDVTICSDSLAQYRAKYPLPEEFRSKDEVENLPPRPSPQHRHSIAITSLAPPSAHSPPLASPTLVAASNRLSPFALARRASRKNRPPPQPRTKSTNDVLKEAAVPPLLSPDSETPSMSDRRSSIVSLAPTSTEETPLAARASLDRDSTIKEKRTTGAGAGPRKLRKNPASRPPLPVIRTDDDFLLRPSSQFRSRSPSPIRSSDQPASSSPTTSRKQGWRSSLSNFVSPVASPTTSFQMPHELSIPPQPRSPSPIDSFPSTIRRESSLPPVDRSNTNRPRTDSLSDSYFGDSENHRLPHSTSSSSSQTRRDRTRTQSAQIPSPSSPVSTGNLWARALKLGRKGAGSRASSVASSSASTTSWDMVEGEASERGTFEVLRSSKVSPVLSTSRPMARRTTSEGGGPGAAVDADTRRLGRSLAEGQILEASTSSPNLSKITEYPESLDSRFLNHQHLQHYEGNTNPYRYLSTGSPPASVDSFHATPSSQGGFHTPPVTANSSNTILALDSTPSTAVSAARRVRSRSALTATVEPPQAIDEQDLPPLPSPLHTQPSIVSAARSRTHSDASTTYRSTHSSSQDSIFSREDEEDRRGSPDDGGEETGATSVTEGEEDEDEADLLKRKLVIDDVVRPGVAI
ncbi:hypothetical protein JCM3765_005208 [Sporobolomyces pararoseus]